MELDKMTKTELLKHAKEKDIDVSVIDSKKTLIEKIEATPVEAEVETVTPEEQATPSVEPTKREKRQSARPKYPRKVGKGVRQLSSTSLSTGG